MTASPADATSGLLDQAWLVTGSAGRVGSHLGAVLPDFVGSLRQTDVVPGAGVRELDVLDRPALERAFAGVHGVVHLGGLSDEADLRDLLEVNVLGTANVLEAARRSGVRRVVFASSNRLTGCYPAGERVDPGMTPRPDGFYGVSKVAGEALGSVYADKFGLEVVCVRIGSFAPEPRDERHLSTWLSPGDATRAFLAAMTAEVSYAVFYAVSANTRRWWDLAAGERVGFVPQDDAEQWAESVRGTYGPRAQDPQSGLFATPEFTLDRQRD